MNSRFSVKHKNKKWKSYYRVSLEIVSHRDNLAEISNWVGCSPEDGCINIGEKRTSDRKKSKYSYWRKFTNLSMSAGLDDHFDFLMLQLKKLRGFKKTRLRKDYEIDICVAKFFNTRKIWAAGIRIKPKYVKWLAMHKMGMEIIGYPCSP